MKSLKELVDLGEKCDLPELSVIKAYLSQPEVISDAVPLLTALLQDRIKELEKFKAKQRCWQSAPFDFYYRQFPLEVAAQLDFMSRKLILNLSLSEKDTEWIKENVPNLKKPTAMWHELYEEIHRLGVSFKDE